jgi:hypothetical protein
MSDGYSANAVLFNPSNSDVPLEFSWENEISQTHAKGMTAFLGISSIFFKEGQEKVMDDSNCIVVITDDDGAAESEELSAIFVRDPFVPPSEEDSIIPAGTKIYTSSNEPFHTVTDTVFNTTAPKTVARVRPDDVSTRQPGHEIGPFVRFDAPNSDTFDTSIKLSDDCSISGHHLRQDLDLRSDWRTRWMSFQNMNSYLNDSEYKVGFYLDEPLWRQITNSELSTFVGAVKTAYPNRPLVVIGAAKEWLLDSIILPQGVDWFGFDKYGVKDPLNNPEYKKLIDQTLALIMQNDDMKMLIVGDVFLTPEYSKEYYDLARFTERVVALGWFAWSLNERRWDESGKGLLEHIDQERKLERLHRAIGETVVDHSGH